MGTAYVNFSASSSSVYVIGIKNNLTRFGIIARVTASCILYVLYARGFKRRRYFTFDFLRKFSRVFVKCFLFFFCDKKRVDRVQRSVDVNFF